MSLSIRVLKNLLADKWKQILSIVLISVLLGAAMGFYMFMKQGKQEDSFPRDKVEESKRKEEQEEKTNKRINSIVQKQVEEIRKNAIDLYENNYFLEHDLSKIYRVDAQVYVHPQGDDEVSLEKQKLLSKLIFDKIQLIEEWKFSLPENNDMNQLKKNLQASRDDSSALIKISFFGVGKEESNRLLDNFVDFISKDLPLFNSDEMIELITKNSRKATAAEANKYIQEIDEILSESLKAEEASEELLKPGSSTAKAVYIAEGQQSKRVIFKFAIIGFVVGVAVAFTYALVLYQLYVPSTDALQMKGYLATSGLPVLGALGIETKGIKSAKNELVELIDPKRIEFTELIGNLVQNHGVAVQVVYPDSTDEQVVTNLINAGVDKNIGITRISDLFRDANQVGNSNKVIYAFSPEVSNALKVEQDKMLLNLAGFEIVGFVLL